MDKIKNVLNGFMQDFGYSMSGGASCTQIIKAVSGQSPPNSKFAGVVNPSSMKHLTLENSATLMVPGSVSRYSHPTPAAHATQVYRWHSQCTGGTYSATATDLSNVTEPPTLPQTS